MRIVRDRNTYVVTMAFDDHTTVKLDSVCLTANQCQYYGVTTQTHELLTVDAPAFFVAGALSFSDDTWFIEDADAFNAVKASAVERAIRQLDDIAALVRSTRISHYTKDMSYARKAAAARAVLSGNTEQPILLPLVGVQVKADGTVCTTLQEVATVIVAKADADDDVDGRLDASVLAAKNTVRSAESQQAMDEAISVVQQFVESL